MVRLEDSSPKMPRRRSRRQLSPRVYTIVTRLIYGIVFILAVTTLYNRIWQPTEDDYTVSEHDMGFIQSFCSVIRSTSQDTVHSLPVQEAINYKDQIPEHWRIPHLRPSTAPDRDNIPESVWQDLPVKGVLYMFVENSQLPQARAAIRSVEDRFNHRYRYPWVFLNHQYFSTKVQKYIAQTTDAPVFFGKVDLDAWNYPEWIESQRAEELMQKMAANNVYRGGSLSYRQYLRYHSGGFFHHPLLQNVDYVWRVNPGSHYTCDVEEDLFNSMHENNKTLGIALTEQEAPNAVNSLWPLSSKFREMLPHHVLPVNETITPWLFTENKYNYCQFNTHFQIVKMDFFRSQRYQTFFSYLDKIGGFFYERWSDGAVQTLAAAMFLPRNEIQFMDQIGLEFGFDNRCPVSSNYISGKCACEMRTSHDFADESCSLTLLNYIDQEKLMDIVNRVENRLVLPEVANKNNHL